MIALWKLILEKEEPEALTIKVFFSCLLFSPSCIYLIKNTVILWNIITFQYYYNLIPLYILIYVYIYFCNVKAEFSASLLWSSVSHDPSEINLICWFGAQEMFLNIINIKNCFLEPYRYQNVTCKLCWSLIGRRESSLLRHWTCDTRPSSTALPARFKSAQPAKDRTQLLFKQTHVFASTTK